MRILHYISSIDRNVTGVSSYMQTLCRAIGDKVELHVVTHHSENELELANCTIHYVSHDWYWVVGRIKRQYEALLDDIKPDVVHCNSCWMPWFAYAVIYAKRKGYKVVLTPHGMLEPWIIKRNYWMKKWPALMLYQRRAIEMADCIHATAESEGENIRNMGYDNIEIIPNCVEIDGIEMKQSWERNRKMLYLGRIHEKKGLAFLLETVSDMKRNKTWPVDYEVKIVGDRDIDSPEYLDVLKKMVLDLDVSDVVKFHDGVYGDDKWQLFREADVFVLPTYSENFGIVVAEALACGTPVITTQGTPWEELVSNNCGWWTEVGKKGLKESLLDFMRKDESNLEVMGRNGRRLIEERYSSRCVAEQYMNLYGRFISVSNS